MENNNFNIAYTDIISDLRSAAEDSQHPYRYAGLSTVNQSLGVQSRTVVIRKFIEDDQLLVYSDDRTQKIKDIALDNRVSLLCYHPSQRSQVRINGVATIIKSGELYEKHKHSIAPHGVRDYNSQVAPGSIISQHEEILRGKEVYFCIISIKLQQLDYLKLDRPEHYRFSFRREAGRWQSVQVMA